MGIPVEQIGSERQRIPAVLLKIEKNVGLVKYAQKLSPIKVALTELQLAPSAFELCEDVFAHTEHITSDHTTALRSTFSPRDPAEIWLSTELTTRKALPTGDGEEVKPTDAELNGPATAQGAWWSGRVLTTQSGFAHVEVSAPLVENSSPEDKSSTLIVPHMMRMGSSTLPLRSTLVRLDEIRSPWNGQLASNPKVANGVHKDNFSETHSLATNGVLNRHTICIPAYLARLASSADSHAALFKFCAAPCLVQCDPEPFLANQMAKLIINDGDSAVVSGRQTPNMGIDSELQMPPSITVSADSSAPSWPSPCVIARSTILGAPAIAGTLSPAGVTDPTLLLEGLPGATGPLVLLNIWSGSSEAIRRAALLELAHVRILVFRYHVMRKLSNGEPGELDLADSTDAPVENGDAPVMHCKPISIPVKASQENAATLDERTGGTMIGYSAHFRIHPRLIGLAIGYRGATIHEARALACVRNVELLHDGIVHVEAETVDACQSVRNLLDFTEAEIPVSPRLASRLIGSKGINIRKLAASAGVRRAQLLDPILRKRRQQQLKQNQNPTVEHDQSEANSDPGSQRSFAPDKVATEEDVAVEHTETEEEEDLPSPAFYLLGTRAAVAKMRLLLEFQADNWNELDELEETRRSLFTQLRQSNQAIGGRNHYVPTTGNVWDAPPHRDGQQSFRGRGRRTSGRGGSSLDDVPDQDGTHPVSHTRPQPPPRGHPAVNGGGQGGGRPRFNRQYDDVQRNSITEIPTEENDNGASGNPPPTTANGWRPPRGGRGRARPRGKPIQQSS